MVSGSESRLAGGSVKGAGSPLAVQLRCGKGMTMGGGTGLSVRAPEPGCANRSSPSRVGISDAGGTTSKLTEEEEEEERTWSGIWSGGR